MGVNKYTGMYGGKDGDGFLFGYDADGVGAGEGLGVGQRDGDGDFYLAGSIDVFGECFSVNRDFHYKTAFFG